MNSKNIYSEVVCPHCGEKFDFKWHCIINERQQPELARDCKNGKIFVASCKTCKKDFYVSFALTFISDENKYGVSYLERQTLSPSGYLTRVTMTLADFIEKLYILGNNLNDKAIEIIKALTLAQCDSIQQIQRIYLDHFDSNHLYIAMQYSDKLDIVTVPIDIYDKFASTPLLALDDNIVIDLAYANKFLAKE